MKKMRHFLIMMIIMVTMLPLVVKAASITEASYNVTGLSAHGEILSIEGNNTNTGKNDGSGIIRFEDVSNTSTLVTMDVIATADSWREVVSITYELFEGNNSVFTDTISGDDVVNSNDGQVKVRFSFKNNKLTKIKVSVKTRNRKSEKTEETISYTYPIEFFDFSYAVNSCKDKLSVELIKTGSKNVINKKAENQIIFEDIYESKTNVSFNTMLKSLSYYKVYDVIYTMYGKSNNTICSDTVRGIKLRNNTGSAKLKFDITDTNVKKVQIQLTMMTRSGKIEKETVTRNLDISFSSDFDIGKCMTENGSVEFVSAGGNNSIGGNINYKKDSDDFSEFIVQADSGATVEKIPYFLMNSDGSEICSGEITGSKIKEPSVRLKMKFTNGKVRKIKICMYSNQKKEHCEQHGLDIVHDYNDSGGEGIAVKDNLAGISLGDLSPEEFTSNICDEGEESLSVLIKKYWGYVMVCVPILLIIMLIVDFLKAITSNDSEQLKKSGNNSIKRVLAAVILLMLPLVVTTVFNLIGIGNYLCF